MDSGGHYLEGTTDITRTIALGPVTNAERTDFTRVLRSHLHLANARFLYGCSGLNLDILAREPLWEADLDYKHGTGHGVGHILNVHEGPNGFRWRQSPERSEGSVLEEGMITTGSLCRGRLWHPHRERAALPEGRQKRVRPVHVLPKSHLRADRPRRDRR